MTPTPQLVTTTTVATTSAMGASAAYVAHPLLALGLCIIAAVAGVVAYRQRSHKPITCRTARGTIGLAAGLAVGLFAWFESPETNNLLIIGYAFVLGALLDVTVPVIETHLPKKLSKYLGSE